MQGKRWVHSDGARAVLVAAALFLAFNLNFRAIESRDTAVTSYVALTIAAHGDVDLERHEAVTAAGLVRGYVQTIDGHARSAYPLLPAVFAAPAYRVAISLKLIDRDRPRPAEVEAVGKLVASGLVALACGVLCLVIRRWTPHAPAVVIALGAGLATPLWSSASQALWSHGPAALCLVAGLGGVLLARGSKREMAIAAASGAALALAVACRPLLIAFPLGLAFGLWRDAASRRLVAPYVIGGAIASAGVAAMNLLAIGNALGGQAYVESAAVHQATHNVAGPWSGVWLEGLAGILVSPSRGLLVFAPIAGLAFLSIGRAWRAGPLARYGVVVPTLLFIAGWAQYAVWWGGHSYGPRYAADIAVPLALIVAAGWDAPRRAAGRASRILVVVALVWSIGVQAVGAFCYPAGEWNGRPVDVDRAHARLWDWRDSQIVRTARAGLYQLAKRQTQAAPPR